MCQPVSSASSPPNAERYASTSLSSAATEQVGPALRHLIRVYLANRGVWEALVGAGPTCSVAADDSDVEAYLAGFGSLLAELTA